MAKIMDELLVYLPAVGAVNWGLVTFVKGFNLVTWLTGFLGTWAGFSAKAVYAAVAISGVIVLYRKIFKK